MKIVQYMLGFRSRDGGVVRALIDLSNALGARGHLIKVLTTDACDAPRDWDGRDGRPFLQILPFNRHIGEGVLTAESKRLARESMHGAHLLHLHVPWDLICLQTARMARRMNIPYIMSVHGMLDDWTMASRGLKKRLYLALGGRQMLERAAFVQCAAQVEMEQSQKWYPRGRSIIAPLLFDLRAYVKLPAKNGSQLQELQINSSSPCIVYLGRLHPIKRIELLIQAVACLHKDGLGCQLLIAGSGAVDYETSLRQCVEREQLSRQVHFLGFVSGAAKLSLLRSADVAVLPSAHESFGLSLIEALACGAPVVTTKAVNIWRELERSGGAVITDDKPPALAAALKPLLQNRAHRDKMGQAGRRWVFDYLEPNRVVRQYESMYQQAVARK